MVTAGLRWPSRDRHCRADQHRQHDSVRQGYSYQPDSTVGETAVDDHDSGSHEHQGKRAERLGDQPTSQRGHARSFCEEAPRI